MCSYVTEKSEVKGSGKGAAGWFRLSHVMASVDHPYHAPYGHTVNLDFMNLGEGAGARVAVELTPDSARELVACIERALAAAGDVAVETPREGSAAL